MKNISQSFIVIFFFVSQLIIAQNVGINSTAANPDNSAMLDIVSSNKGLLIPRVTLTSISDVSTIPNPAISLLVYNTAAAGIAPNNVIPGYYYYNGTAWVILTTGTFNDWKLAGNAGTTAGTDFIGTTDGQDVVFKRNNSEIARITQDGIGIGSTSPTVGVTAGAYLHFGNAANITSTSGLDIIIDNDNTSSTVNFRVRKDGTTTLMQIQEDGTVSMGISNTNPDVSAILDIKSNTRGVLLPRISLTSITDAATIPTPTTSLLVYNTNSSITNGNGVGYYYNSGTSASPNWVKLYASNAKPWETSGNAGTTAGTNFVGTTDAVDFVTKTNNTERMRITSAGAVAINTISPASSAILDVSSTTSGFLPPRMTTAQRNAITAPAAGLMIYNTTTGCIDYYSFSTWQTLAGPLPSISSISGYTIVGCTQTATYSVAAVTGGIYTWAVTSGASIASGQGTNSITVTFAGTLGTAATSTISLIVSTACSSSSASSSLAVTYGGKTTFATAGSFTWGNINYGVNSAKVECWGGGGAGGGALANGGASAYADGGGGAGGAYAQSTLPLVAGTTYNISVAAAVTSIASGTTDNVKQDGNPSWFSSTSTIYAQGGQGGTSRYNPSSNSTFLGVGGTGSASSSIGTITKAGGNGGTPTGTGSSVAGGGGSSAGPGASPFTGVVGNNGGTAGAAGAAVTGGGAGGSGTSGAAGSVPGGGGSGYGTGGSAWLSGGNGAAGQVIVSW